MIYPPKTRSLTCLILLAGTAALQAHIGYSGRDFGSFSSGGSVTILNQTVSGTFGWADGTDADYGDSHRMRAYRFNLGYDATITLTASATTNNGALLGDLLPAFSIYGGLAHLPPLAADYDYSIISAQWNAALPGVAREGSFNALGDWKIGSDEGTSFADLSSFTFKGYAADGTSANFGNTPGLTGDGTADGTVTGTWNLTAGSYTILLGGADYAAQGPAPYVNRGVNLTLTVVPEPAAGISLLAAAAGLLLRRRR